jgi:hypothetical protein
MKLLSEMCENIEVLEEGSGGTKSLYITGPFMMYDEANKNRRIYPKAVMEKEVTRYINEKVNTKQALGELQHPQTPSINLDRVSHLIESLEIQNNGTVFGKAKILNTPMGNIVRGLLEGGASIGVSTRGLGSLKEGRDGISEVQDDFKLVTAADIVADPSAHKAYVNGIMENVEYFYDSATGEYSKQILEYQKKEIHKLSIKQINEKKALFFEQFLNSLIKK